MSPRRARRLPDSVPRKGRGGTALPGRAGQDDEDEEPGSPGTSLDRPAGPERREEWADGEWVIRLVSGAAATKAYRCPGCDQEILAGTPHLVAWPALTPGLEMRRHWHRACWQRRLTRRPGTRKPRPR
jgi:hypothetical protein